MYPVKEKSANDVNGATDSVGGDASGSGSSRASKVVNKRNPCGKQKKLKIGTWNIRSMLRPGKLANVIQEMRKARLDILGLAEMRWKEGGEFTSNITEEETEEIRVIYAGGKERQRGVALLLKKELSRNITNIERYEDRVIMVTIEAEPVNLTILQVYMPTTTHTEEEVDGIYEYLEEKLERIRATNFCVLMGDWNAVVGKGREGNVVGEYGMGVRNERGEKLIEFCKLRNMMITNTWFKNENRRIYTWKMPGDIARYQIDYIMVNGRYRNCVKNARAYPGADADTDHNLVVMKVRIQLKYINKRKQLNLQWDRDKIKEKATEIAGKIEKQVTTTNTGRTMEERWEKLKSVVVGELEQEVGRKKRRKAKKPWVTNEMIEDMEQRRKWKRQNTEYAKKEYRRLNNQLRRSTEKAKEKWWENKCQEIEKLQGQGKHDQVYKEVKDLTKKEGMQGSKAGIKDKQGNTLTTQREVEERWKEYIEELYLKDDRPMELNIEKQQKVESEELGPGLMKEEILLALEEMKNNKAEGVDHIPAEAIKILGENAMNELVEICQQIYITGEWPKDFLQSIMIPIKKKVNAMECGDHRTISLLCHAAKIILKVITKRVQAKTDAIGFLGEDQFGFRRGKGTRDAIGCLRMLSERRLQNGKNIYICFVDYEKAFDRVDWRILMRALKRVGVDWRDRRLIANLYLGQSVKVRIEGELSESCLIGRGVRQGCPLSPLLFNIYIEELVQEAMENTDEGVKVGGVLVKALRFADDQAMLAGSQKGLQEVMDKLTQVSEKYGMRINTKKTKVMVISKKEGKRVEIKVYGQNIEQVKEFSYLGSLITTDARCNKEIRRRIAIAKEAFYKRKELMQSKLNLNLKKRLVKTLIWSVALYGAETWTMRKEDIKRLEAFEMWIWRKMQKVKYTEHKTNEEVMKEIEEDRSLIDTIRKRQRNWMGHVLRHDSLLRTIIEGKMEGKRVRGIPRKMMLEWMMDKGYQELKEEASNRSEWENWIPGPVERQKH